MNSKVLGRQLRRAFGVADGIALSQLLERLDQGDAQAAAETGRKFSRFLDMVDEAYLQAERDLTLRTRSLELSSAELVEANAHLQRDAQSMQRAIEALRHTAEQLVDEHDPVGARESIGDQPSIERLAELMKTLVATRRDTEEQVRASEERLALALESAGDGSWDWNLVSNALQLDDRCHVMLGYGRAELPSSHRAWRSLLHPDHVATTRAQLSAHLSGRSTAYVAEHRLRAHDGTWRWIAMRGKVVARRVDGQALRMVGTMRDVTKDKERELAWLRAKEEAESAIRAKGDFLASVSHEIRTPMNAIIGMTDLVLETQLDVDQRRNLEIARGSAESLLTIINDVLDFSKIESGQLKVETLEFAVPETIVDILKALSLRAHQKGLELVFDMALEVPSRVVGDPGRLRQVLINLVGNAIKFTDSGEIEIGIAVARIERRTVTLEITVSDSGIGIPVEQQSRIFEAFTQADSSITRRYGGTGLGLTISKRLVELMNGTITVDSQPGRGSTFRFRVELERVDDERYCDRYQYEPSLEGIPGAIVVNNERLRRHLVRLFERWGMKPSAFDSCGAASAALCTTGGEPARVVIIDAVVGEEDGLELAAQLAISATAPIVIMLTPSMHFGQVSNRAHAAGIQHCVAKPVSCGELRVKLSDAFFPDRAGARVSLEPVPVARSVAPAAAPARTDTPAGALRILLAEDNQINRYLARRILEQDGHQVIDANDGLEAVRLWEANSFDVILMDVQMPAMDGLEATVEIRRKEAEQHLPRTPIVAVTANAMHGDRERCVQAGMDDYLSKPFLKNDLRATLVRTTQPRAGGADRATGQTSASLDPA